MTNKVLLALAVISSLGSSVAASAQSCGLACDMRAINHQEQATRGGYWDPNADAQRREAYRNQFGQGGYSSSPFGFSGGLPGRSVSVAAGDTVDAGEGTLLKEARTKINGRCEKISAGDMCKGKDGSLFLITKKGQVIPIPAE